NRDAGLELDPFGLHLLKTPIDNPLFHFEIWNPVAKQAADTVSLFEHGHAMARPRQLLGSGKPGRSRTHDGDRLPRLRNRENGFDQAFMETAVNDVPFDHADGDRIFINAKDAGAFAGRRTETAGKFWKVVGGMQCLEGVLPAAAIDEIV